jgi:UDP-glucose 6-dehydrogenase
MMRLAVVGHGTLGIVATCFADAGHRVIGIECDRDGLTALKAREPSVYEPGFGMLPPCLGSGRGVSFFVSSADIAGDLDAVVIAVWTATLPTHLAYLGQVNRVLGEVLRLKMLPRFAMTKGAIPPGAGIELVREANRSALAEGYVHCPEFFSQGRAIEKWRRPERLIIGLWTEAFLPELRDLYRRGQAPRW